VEVVFFTLHPPVFVNRLDYLVLIATILAIPLYGLWRTGERLVGQYLKGDASIQWARSDSPFFATQAGRSTFLSIARPGV